MANLNFYRYGLNCSLLNTYKFNRGQLAQHWLPKHMEAAGNWGTVQIDTKYIDNEKLLAMETKTKAQGNPTISNIMALKPLC